MNQGSAMLEKIKSSWHICSVFFFLLPQMSVGNRAVTLLIPLVIQSTRLHMTIRLPIIHASTRPPIQRSTLLWRLLPPTATVNGWFHLQWEAMLSRLPAQINGFLALILQKPIEALITGILQLQILDGFSLAIKLVNHRSQ